MKKIWLFTSVLASSLTGFAALTIWMISSMPLGPTQQDWMRDMMNRMMGEIPGSSPAPSYFFIVPAVLLASPAIGLVGTVFLLIFPEIRLRDHEPQEQSLAPLSSIMKTLKPDERLVVDIIQKHGGSYLQKYVSKEAGLSRLKTHRIVARFSERGIVTVRRRGNTNEIILSDWLNPRKQ